MLYEILRSSFQHWQRIDISLEFVIDIIAFPAPNSVEFADCIGEAAAEWLPQMLNAENWCVEVS